MASDLDLDDTYDLGSDALGSIDLSDGDLDTAGLDDDTDLGGLTGSADGLDPSGNSINTGSSVTGSSVGSSSNPSSTNWGSLISGIASGSEGVLQTLGLTNVVSTLENDLGNASNGVAQVGVSSKEIVWVLAIGIGLVVVALAFF